MSSILYRDPDLPPEITAEVLTQIKADLMARIGRELVADLKCRVEAYHKSAVREEGLEATRLRYTADACDDWAEYIRTRDLGESST